MQAVSAPAAVFAEAPIAVMKRVEYKYVLNRDQLAKLRLAMAGRMQEDRFGLTTIASLYYDTPDDRLIRASMDKPIYKEKLRLRSYGRATESSPVYLELKRKYDGTVYKRRIQTTVGEAAAFLRDGQPAPDGQIGRELVAFRDHYRTLVPRFLILYERTAYFAPGGDLRLTIDRNLRYRTERLELTGSTEGAPLLDDGCVLLELKVQSAVPLWLSHALSEAGIRKTNFSKCGEAYRRDSFRGRGLQEAS